MIPTQIFLPFLGIIFTKKFTNTNGVARTKLSYNAQLLLIKLLYLPRIKYSKADIAQRLQLNPVYVTRATKELLDMGLISEYKEGRSVFVERENSSEELFDSAKQLFVSPISKVIYVKKNKRLQEYPIASDSALSEISMINPSDVPVYACWKKDALVNDVKIIDEPSWNDSDDMVKLELWDYDPKKLSDGKTVDIVSLYCSLMNNNDPRIQGEMEDILEDFEWQL
jgi:DNA-binding MarR family transcriptional regulator